MNHVHIHKLEAPALPQGDKGGSLAGARALVFTQAVFCSGLSRRAISQKVCLSVTCHVGVRSFAMSKFVVWVAGPSPPSLASKTSPCRLRAASVFALKATLFGRNSYPDIFSKSLRHWWVCSSAWGYRSNILLAWCVRLV